MIRISGIKYQQELEDLPYVNKQELVVLIGKEGKNLDKKIDQLKKKHYLLSLKKGMYVTASFFDATDKERYYEYIANILRSPSYISLEYILAREGLIPEGIYAVTSITIKSSRTYTNVCGTFSYRTIKNRLFLGYETMQWNGKMIAIATRAKALFDFLYLKRMIDIRQEILSDLRIQWNVMTQKDMAEFETYVHIADSRKMTTIWNVVRTSYVS